MHTGGEPTALGSGDRELVEGDTVGEYVFRDQIGKGGFGTVYRAGHPLIGKEVAIKVLSRRYSSDEGIVSRFVAEARAVNQIRHRNIIDIFAFGQLEGDGRHYYVMELLDGAPLDVHLEQVGRMALVDAIPVLRSIGKALDAAHAKGIAHRDLKPENIFLVRDPDGSIFPKLLDFGIAKLLSARTGLHKTRTGAPIGTPYYMSPEQCRGRDVDHRTDVYAFGCVAYELLTGDVPFDGTDYMDILLAQLNDEAPAPSVKVPGLPASVDASIAWMLRKDPAQRPPDLSTAIRALEQAAEASGIAFPRAPASQVWSTSRGPGGGAVTPTPANLAHAVTIVSGARPVAGVEDGNRGGRPGLWIGLGLAALMVGVGTFVMVRGDRSPTTASSASAAVVPAPMAMLDAGATVVEVDAGLGARLVTVQIAGVPAGTEVYAPHGLVGVAPGAIQLERGRGEVVLTFKADGYTTASMAVTPAADQSLVVALVKKEAASQANDSRSGKGGAGKGGKGGKGTGKGTGADRGSGAGTGSNTNPLIEDPFKSP